MTLLSVFQEEQLESKELQNEELKSEVTELKQVVQQLSDQVKVFIPKCLMTGLTMHNNLAEHGR